MQRPCFPLVRLIVFAGAALALAARGAETNPTAKSTGHSKGSTGHVQHVQAPPHTATSHGQPTGGTAHIEHAQAPQHPATRGGHPPSGVPVVRPGGPGNQPAAAPTSNAAVKAAASAPPAPVYHYNFPTKSGLIGRDFARPLTPEEQSAMARQIADGQPAKTQAAPGGYQYDNGVYHYNVPTKSGIIGRDFTRPLTSEEQSAIGRQAANAQPAKPQVPPGVASTQAKVNPLGAKHFNLPGKPDLTIASMKFEGTGHIKGSETWTDPKYAAFRDYHHEWHNQEWWKHHSQRIVMIAGGWYFWRSGYWYPAWGYSTTHNYYPYDGPIYARNGLAPDQVVANVQAALQALGYYNGPINGLLSPATREALANYQSNQGLYTTEAIDEPTLAALGMA